MSNRTHDIADAALVALPQKVATRQAEEAEAAVEALAQKIRDYGAEEGDQDKLAELARVATDRRAYAERGDHGPHRYA